jgi:predicted MFS family arabinose efflux permease
MSGLHNTRAYWSGVLAMTLCVFVLIASEFMPVSLLTPIAGDLHYRGISRPGIALSGALAVLTSLTISRLTGSLDRKWLLLGLTALMAASGLMIALASSFPVYMLGRALIGIVIGGFWSMSAATAIRLVPQRQVPAHWPSLTAVTRWPPLWQRRWAALGPPSAGAAPFYVLSRWRW